MGTEPMNSEEIINQLLAYVARNGKIPEIGELGLDELIKEAITTFGSLENALRVSGLLSESSDAFPRLREKKKRFPTQIMTKPKNKFQNFPDEYFLSLLKLKRSSSYPAVEGTPKWWEKKAGKVYICSLCHKSIEKTERYIGRKTLTPGQKGIYGHRGTYHTHYFHILCLLREVKNETEKNIASINQEIGFIEVKIGDFKSEIGAKMKEIATNSSTIEQKRAEYDACSRLGKILKWLGINYSISCLNNENSRLKTRIDRIENYEIPDCKRRITEKSARKNEQQQYLAKLEANIKRLEFLLGK
jgi:hypothetical protein